MIVIRLFTIISSAEVEYFSELREHIKQGEIIPIDEAERAFMLKMKQHNIEYSSEYSNAQTERKWLQQKIEENMAVGESADKPDLHDNMKMIFQASMVIGNQLRRLKTLGFSMEH